MKVQSIVLVSVVALAAASACADFTPIANGGTTGASNEALVFGGNANIARLLGAAYGGGATGTATLLNNGRSDGTNFVDFQIMNGSTVVAIARRVADRASGGGVGNVMNVSSGNWNDPNVTDQVWQDSIVATTARGVFAGDIQHLFTVQGDGTGANGATDHRFGVTNPSADAFNPAATYYGGSGPRLVPSSPFRWMRASGSTDTGNPLNDVASGAIDYSRQSNNGSSVDEMVTYQIFGADGTSLIGGNRRFMMFFEDRTNGDRDFNDLAFELVVTIPLPPAAYAGLGSLACVGLFGMIRRRKNAAV